MGKLPEGVGLQAPEGAAVVRPAIGLFWPDERRRAVEPLEERVTLSSLVDVPTDDGPPLDRLPWEALVEVAEVFGVSMAPPDGWRTEANWRRRYFGEALRHLVSFWLGETVDPQSGCSPLAHAAQCVLILLAREQESSAHPRARR